MEISQLANWKLATCTCPVYYKKYICKHIVGVAMMQKMTNACPPTAKNVPFDKKRKPGRPRLAPLAGLGICKNFYI